MRKTSIVLVTMALFLGACFGDTGPDPAAEPKEALTNAFDKLGDGGYRFVVRLDSDTDSLIALSADEGGTPMEQEDAQKLLDSSFSMATTDEEDPAERNTEIQVNVAGNEDAVEARAIDKALYLRAEVREIAELLGQSPSELDRLAAESPPGFEFLGPAIDGEWLAVDNLEELSRQLTGGMAPTPDAGAQQQFVDHVGTALEGSSEVTSEGEDDAGHRLVAKVSVREFYEQIRGSLQSLAGQLPKGSLPPATEVPDEDVSFDVWVDGGEVSQMRLDLLQLEVFGDEPVPEGVDRLAILIEVEGFGDSVDVPDDAVEVDTTALMQGLLQGAAGASGSESITAPGNPDELCDQLAGAPPEILEQFAEQCPELAQ